LRRKKGAGAGLPVSRAKSQTSHGAGTKNNNIFFSINIFNDNKYNNFCTPNNNIFLY
jgi:hypothetical protein